MCRLAYFERNYVFMTNKQLISEATTHYAGQAIKQAYVLVLGLDVIGNPYGLVVGTMKGIEDLFYEPFQGAIQGPGEFAEGLFLGVRSMLGHTVGGMAGAVSKITGAMGMFQLNNFIIFNCKITCIISIFIFLCIGNLFYEKILNCI